MTLVEQTEAALQEAEAKLAESAAEMAARKLAAFAAEEAHDKQHAATAILRRALAILKGEDVAAPAPAEAATEKSYFPAPARIPAGPACPACGTPGLVRSVKEIQGRPVSMWACHQCRNESLG